MSRTYLVRTEPRGTEGSLEPGLAARISDPLWMLGRQWQLGELLGDDSGSPVAVDLAAETATLTRFRRPGQTSGIPYDPADVPLDVLTGDPVRTQKGWTARLKVDTGRAFLHALREAGLESYAEAYRSAFVLDPATAALRAAQPQGARLLDVASGRIPDGEQLYAALVAPLRTGADLPDPPKIDSADADDVRAAATAWLEFCENSLAETGSSTWLPDRLAHGFGVATGGGAGDVVLDAEGFGGDALDWHSFDARPATPSGFDPLPATQTVPTGVRFRGMPNARWWELEDGSVDLGAVDAGPSDVARLALLEFALVYGNDFFAVPLRLPVGSLTRITSLVVADTFGMHLAIEPAAHRAHSQGAQRWSMFTLSEREPGTPGASAVSDVFFLAPVAGQLVAGPAVEEVQLLRDEMANMAWGVERRYEGEAGGPTEAVEEMTRGLPERDPPPADAALRYVLGTTVPPYWFPLVPVQGADGVRLNLEQMANRASSVKPRGRFLILGGDPIPDAEVPREGRRLVRDYALARWTNGKTFAWARRVRRVGRGEGSSGLRFDATELETPEQP